MKQSWKFPKGETKKQEHQKQPEKNGKKEGELIKKLRIFQIHVLSSPGEGSFSDS